MAKKLIGLQDKRGLMKGSIMGTSPDAKMTKRGASEMSAKSTSEQTRTVSRKTDETVREPKPPSRVSGVEPHEHGLGGGQLTMFEKLPDRAPPCYSISHKTMDNIGVGCPSLRLPPEASLEDSLWRPVKDVLFTDASTELPNIEAGHERYGTVEVFANKENCKSAEA